MTATANGRVVPGQLESFGVPPFDGYPYLVTRIGHSALRHVTLLPADWSRRWVGLRFVPREHTS